MDIKIKEVQDAHGITNETQKTRIVVKERYNYYTKSKIKETAMGMHAFFARSELKKDQ